VLAIKKVKVRQAREASPLVHHFANLAFLAVKTATYGIAGYFN
jgi:hypothetical protein